MSRFIVSACLAVAGSLLGELLRRLVARGTHRRCGTEAPLPPPSPHLWVPVMTSAALFALGWTFLPELWPMLVVNVPVAVGAVWMSAVDIDVNRLPDVVTLPLLLWAATTLFLVSLVLPTVCLLTAIAGAAMLAGFLWLLNLASKGGLGLGDAKAGALIDFLAGATSLQSVWLVGMLAFPGALTFVGLSRRRNSSAQTVPVRRVADRDRHPGASMTGPINRLHSKSATTCCTFVRREIQRRGRLP